MKFLGKVIKYGANVDTDVIIPARYLNTSVKEELAAHCMEDLDPDFRSKVEPGDIIVIDNGGRLDTSCWGGILANSAKMKKVSGTVIDGCCRDLDDIIDADYPVFARGCVVATARGRIMEQSTNEMISFGGVQVRPGDVVMCDRSGVVIVPWEHVDEVLGKAEELYDKEEAMLAEIFSSGDLLGTDDKFDYEKMLKK